MTAENVTPGQSGVPSIVYVFPAPVAPYANTVDMSHSDTIYTGTCLNNFLKVAALRYALEAHVQLHDAATW